MGRDIPSIEFSPQDRVRYREKVKGNLAALAELMETGRFETGRRMIGVELEVYLVDADGGVMPINDEVLQRLPSEDFQTELAQFNIEFDIKPRRMGGRVLADVEDELRLALDRANTQAEALGGQVMCIGILPTLTAFDVTEDNLSRNPRYKALNDMILAARGEDIIIHIEGDETLETETNSILMEAACTSMQLHLQVDPDEFAVHWNAAQALSAPLLAAAANSPLFLGKLLHHETRIALFQQATDTRPEELAEQGVRPRVWFGERWLDQGVFELFDENVRYYPSLLPLCDEEDPRQVLDSGEIPHLPELSLHNGTIYRWNRPVYAVARGRAHLRVENRVLPAGPTVTDGVANAALFYGLIAALVADEEPVWERMSFQAAEANFFTAARQGLHAKLYWPGVGDEVPVTELLVRHLLPRAREGLRAWGIDDDHVEHYLGIIEQRMLARQNGATWQIATYQRLLDSGFAPEEALRELVRRYQKLARNSAPVHTWSVDG